MLSRRDLVGKLAAGAAGVVVLGAAAKPTNATVATHGAEGTPEHGDGTTGNLPATSEASIEETAHVASEPPPSAPAEPPPWELFRPLVQGAEIAHGWRLADLRGPVDGACVLTLENERGRLQRIHLCRNDGWPQGLVYTDRFDLIVMNGGMGDLGTEENLAQAVAAISHVLAVNEESGHRAISALLPHAQRLQQFANANEWTLR